MLLKINGVEMPEITEISMDDINIVDSSRNDHGDLVHEFITKKQQIIASVGMLTNEQRQSIYTQLAVNNGLSLVVTFNDPGTGKERTINCYTGDRSIKIAKLENGIPTRWKDFQFTLIEN